LEFGLGLTRLQPRIQIAAVDYAARIRGAALVWDATSAGLTLLPPKNFLDISWDANQHQRSHSDYQ